MSKTKYPTIAFGRRKRIDISKFKGKIYVHIHDMQKDKSITLDKDEISVLYQLKSKINKKIQKIIKSDIEDQENSKDKSSKKKNNKYKAKDSESSSDEGMGDDSSDSEP